MSLYLLAVLLCFSLASGRIFSFSRAGEMFDADPQPVRACDLTWWQETEMHMNEFITEQLRDRNSTRILRSILDTNPDTPFDMVNFRLAIVLMREIKQRKRYVWNGSECYILPGEAISPDNHDAPRFPMRYVSNWINRHWVDEWLRVARAEADHYADLYREPAKITITDGADECGIFGVQCDHPGCARLSLAALREYPRCKPEDEGQRVACSYCFGPTFRPRIVIDQ